MYNEKKKAHYNLSAIKELIKQKQFFIRKIAVDNAMMDFGLNPNEIIEYVLNIKTEYFYKSMTSNYDNTLWQDVYHVPINNELAYVKLQIHKDLGVIIQFKRK